MGEAFLDTDEIRKSSFVRHVEIYDEIGSTNDRAVELAKSLGVELPALIVARRQTAGRGRGTNRWWATEGALTFSLLIDSAKLGVSTRDWPRLSLTIAVAICDALCIELVPTIAEFAKNSDSPRGGLDSGEPSYSTRLAIKWPNDLLIDGAKVGGILIESPANPASPERLIVGIGINVNNSWDLAPRDSGGPGIALCDISHRTHDLNALLINILNAIRDRAQQLAENQQELSAAWRRLCWLTAHDVEVGTEGNWTHGRCTGVAPDGALVLQTAIGTQRFYSGSVKVQ